MITNRPPFNREYERISDIHLCERCKGKYIKTMGDCQKICLICERGGTDHNYKNVEKQLKTKYEELGESAYAILFDDK